MEPAESSPGGVRRQQSAPHFTSHLPPIDSHRRREHAVRDGEHLRQSVPAARSFRDPAAGEEPQNTVEQTLLTRTGDAPPSSSDEGPLDAMVPVTFGDLVSFNTPIHHHTDARSSLSGTLIGDPALGRLGLEENEDGHSLRFDLCVFEIVRMLSYRAQDQLEGQSGLSGSQFRLLRDRAEAEKGANLLKTQRSPVTARTVIIYGDVIQLRHDRSKRFIELDGKQRALLEKETRQVTLGGGSAAAHFKILPRWRTRSEGSPVYFGDEIVLQSVASDLFLHASKSKENPKYYSHHSDAVTEEAVGSSSPYVSSCLAFPKVAEVNGSRDQQSFIVQNFARFGPEHDSLLKTRDAFRLFHPVDNSFVQASCRPDKAEARFRHVDGEAVNVPLHVTYNKKMRSDGQATGDDPLNVLNHSAKQLWTFEKVEWWKGGTVLWNEAVRIRHLGSQRYLSCSLITKQKKGSAPKGLLELVEGTQETLQRPLYDNPLIFYVISMEASEFESIPNTSSTLRIEHRRRMSDGTITTLFWRTMDNPKPRSAWQAAPTAPLGGRKDIAAHAVRKKGCMVDFLQEKSSTDLLKLLPAEGVEVQQVHEIINHSPQLRLLQYFLEHGSAENSAGVVPDCAAVTLKIIEGLMVGSSILKKHSVPEWLKVAHRCLPSKFSSLFEGNVKKGKQKAIKELGLMDILFELALAPYQRKVEQPNVIPSHQSMSSPFDQEGMELPKKMQKLVHVALQKSFQEYVPSIRYFAKREALLFRNPRTSQVLPWPEVLSKQSKDALGATVTLSSLLSSDEQTLSRMAGPELLQAMRQNIEDVGPQPRLLKLVLSTCICQGNPIKKNQENAMRNLLMDPSTGSISRKKWGSILMGFQCEADMVNEQLLAWMKTRRRLAHPHLRISRGDLNMKTFLGKDKLNFDDSEVDDDNKGKANLPAVAVCWSGKNGWESGSDALFHSAEDMGIDNYWVEEDKETGHTFYYCFLEDLVWPLDKENLREPVTGHEEIAKQPSLAERTMHSQGSRLRSLSTNASFDDSDKEARQIQETKESRQSQLADYVVSQFQLIVGMCRNRSYNVIKKFEQELSYISLISMASNSLLPNQIRGQALELISALYLDRYPQLTLCGKASLPDLIWIYDGGVEGEGECSAIFDQKLWKKKRDFRRKSSAYKGSMGASYNMSFKGAIQGRTFERSASVLEQKRKAPTDALIANPNALPSFRLSASHPFRTERDQVLSMSVDTKFYLLRETTNTILRDGTSICIQERSRNMLSTAAANVAQLMMSFGFQSNIQKLRDVVVPAALMLDGSTDVKTRDNNGDSLRISAETVLEQAVKDNGLKLTDSIPKEVIYQALEELKVEKATFPDILPRGNHELTKREFVENYLKAKLDHWNRWENSGVDSQQVCHLKRKIIHILMDVSNLRANYRVARMLHFFKTHVLGEDRLQDGGGTFYSMSFSSANKLPIHPSSESKEVKKKAEFLKNLANAVRSGNTSEVSGLKKFDSRLFKRFEMLFKEDKTNDDEDAWQMDLGEISKSDELRTNFGDLLVDILMYEDDDLFADAFGLLSRRFGQRRKLRDALQDVILQDSPWWKGNGSKIKLDDLQAQISFLLYITRSYEVWGVSSRLSGPFDSTKHETLKTTCDTMCNFLDLDEVEENLQERQLLLKAMNLSAPLRIALKIKPDISYHGSICEESDKVKSMEILLNSVFSCLALFLKFVRGNERIQAEMFSAVESLTNLCSYLEKISISGDLLLPPRITETRILALRCVVEVFRRNTDNAKMMAQVWATDGETLPMFFANELAASRDKNGNADDDTEDYALGSSASLAFFVVVLESSAGNLSQNQDHCISAVMEHKTLKDAISTAFKTVTIGNSKVVDMATQFVRNNSRTTERLFTNTDLSAENLMYQISKMALKLKTEARLETLNRQQRLVSRLSSREEKESYAPSLKGIDTSLLDWIVSVSNFCVESLKSGQFGEMTAPEAFWEVLRSTFGRSRGGEGNTSPLDRGTCLIDLFKQLLVLKDEGGLRYSSKLSSTAAGTNGLPLTEKVECLLANIINIFSLCCNRAAQEAELEDYWDRHPDEMEDAVESVEDLLQVLTDLHHEGSSTIEICRQCLLSCNHVASRFVAPLAATPPPTSPAAMKRSQVVRAFEDFKVLVKTSPSINAAMRQRRFAMVELLESNFFDFENQNLTLTAGDPVSVAGKKSTGTIYRVRKQVYDVEFEDGTKEKDIPANKIFPVSDTETDNLHKKQVKVTWPALIRRMVRFVSENFKDISKESTLLLVVEVFQIHLEKARTNKTASLSQRQTLMQENGVTGIIFLIMSFHSPNSGHTSSAQSTGLADASIKLLQELLVGGNRDVQKGLYSLLENAHPDDNKFLSNLRQRALDGLAELKRSRTEIEAGRESRFADPLIHSATTAFTVLKMLVENHMESLQNFMMKQHNQNQNIDMVSLASDMLLTICSEEKELHYLTSKKELTSEGLLVEAILDFLVEVCIGPCTEVQATVASSHAITAVKNIIPSKVLSKSVKLKSQAILLLKSCLEGRGDDVVHNVLRHLIELPMLRSFSEELGAVLFEDFDPERTEKKASLLELIQGQGSKPPPGNEDEDREDLTYAMCSNMFVEQELFLEKAKSTTNIDDEPSDHSQEDELSREIIGRVEVYWGGRVERVNFPLPVESDCLTDKMKDNFDRAVTLVDGDTGRRVYELVEEADRVQEEMELLHELYSSNPRFKFLHRNGKLLKIYTYILVVILNINVIMTEDRVLQRPFLFVRLGTLGSVPARLQIKILTTIALSMAVLLGYVLILFTIVKTEWPMLGDDAWREGRKAQKENEGGVATWQRADHAIPCTVLALLYCTIHLLNYAPNFYLYSAMGFVCVIQFLGMARAKTNEDSGQIVKFLSKCFDCMVLNRRDTGVRGYIFLIVCVILGYADSMFFTFLLFDVFHILSKLTLIMRAIVDRSPALIRMLYLFTISLIAFAVVGQRLFTRQFIPDEEEVLAHRHEDDAGQFEYEAEENWECDSAVSCLLYIGYKGLPAGDISGLMTELDRESASYRSRIAYDLLFFIWIGILLFNIITGLIIDSFASKREEEESRKRIRETECFICGIKNDEYDRALLPPGSATFRQHCKVEHDLWMYLLFIQYLRNKPACEYDGIEMFVDKQLRSSAQDWIPRQTSYAIDVAKQKRAVADGKETQLEMMQSITALEASHRLVMKNLQDMQADMKDLLRRPG